MLLENEESSASVVRCDGEQHRAAQPVRDLDELHLRSDVSRDGHELGSSRRWRLCGRHNGRRCYWADARAVLRTSTVAVAGRREKQHGSEKPHELKSCHEPGVLASHVAVMEAIPDA